MEEACLFPVEGDVTHPERLSTMSEKMISAFPEEIVMTSQKGEAVVRQDNAGCPQDSAPLPQLSLLLGL